jgi:glycosyltransferase involved in cell wall biosynthesis
MVKVLILCDHRPQRSPSQRYRFEQYLPFLEEQGFRFTWSYLLDEKDDKTFYSIGNTFAKARILLKTILIRNRDVKRFKDFDIIFIQREASFLGTSRYEQKAFESGAKVIFDFDDSIWMPDTSPGNRKWQWIKKPTKLYENLKYATVVIAGNSYLANEAKKINANTVIIPTTIDTTIHKPMPEKRADKTITIGWSGSISTIKHFESIEPVLQKLRSKYGEKIRFKMIGQTSYHHPTLNVVSVPWSERTEVEELNSFDIGIMPLPNDEWSKGKCGLKGLSYMACGVPAVMSNGGVNAEIISNGINGFLATTETEWFDVLCRLIENGELREKIGKAGRQTVIDRYSVDANKNKYLEVFTK